MSEASDIERALKRFGNTVQTELLILRDHEYRPPTTMGADDAKNKGFGNDVSELTHEFVRIMDECYFPLLGRAALEAEYDGDIPF